MMLLDGRCLDCPAVQEPAPASVPPPPASVQEPLQLRAEGAVPPCPGCGKPTAAQVLELHGKCTACAEAEYIEQTATPPPDSRKRPGEVDADQLRAAVEAEEKASPPTAEEGVASDKSGDESDAVASLSAGVERRTEDADNHPDDAPPDEAIGQQRCDEPPVAVADGFKAMFKDPRGYAPPEVSTTADSACSTPRSCSASVAQSVRAGTFAPNEEVLTARALLSLQPKVSHNHMAFAGLVARRMEGLYAIERADKENLVVQRFDPVHRIWVRGGGGRFLQEVVTDVLYGIFPDLDEKAKAIFGNAGFVGPVTTLLKNYLPHDRTKDMPTLDGDQTRGLLRFSCGTVLDLRTGVTRPCEPADRISLCTGYAYSDWSVAAETKEFVAELVRDLNALWDKGREVDESTQDMQERLTRAVDESTLYRIFYCLFEDHSTALWLLRQSVRAAAGLAGYEEVLFLVDRRGSNGKGTWLAALKAVLGVDNGYYATLDYDKHFVGSGIARQNINSPDFAALPGKRFVAVNETPEGTDGAVLNTTLIKRLASWDEPFSAMAKYKDPASFQPQCLLAFCTNSEPIFPTKDGGFRSRVSYANMPFEWVETPSGPGQRQIDIAVKERLVKTIQAEFLFWARHLVPGLLRPKARVITPRPAKVQEDVAVQFAASAAGASPAARPEGLGRAFVEERLVVWDKSGPPSGRAEINDAFLAWCTAKGQRVMPHDAFRGVLVGRAERSRVNFEKTGYDVYKQQSPSAVPGVIKVEVVTLR